MRRLLITSLLAIAILASSSVYAHHSAAGIDRNKTVVIEGVVKSFKWGNPHSWLEVEVANTKGGTDVWNFEMNPPAYLVRSGWKASSVKAGDKVKVTGRPFMSGEPGGLFMSVTLADGQVLAAGQQPSTLSPAQTK